MEKEILFEAKHMHKEFGPTIALKDVDFTLRRGEVRGLIGENGSGKSTIMSIASGMQPMTSGEMHYKGKPWNPSTMVYAQEQGVSMILQETNTIANISVAHNIFAGHEKDFTSHGIFSSRKMVQKAQQLLDSFGISHIRAEDNINKYSFEDRKLIEIVRCVTDDTEILVVDETTTALSLEGREILYRVVGDMAAKDKAVVFISHDIDEIFSQCNVLTVLRDGEIIGNIEAPEIQVYRRDPQGAESVKIVRRVQHMMVGREMGEKYYREDHEASCRKETALELKGLTFGGIQGFDLEIKKGEIVGIGGLSGCGMHEIGRAAFGLERLKKGTVTAGGKEIRSPLQAIRAGIGYISKNRDTEALITKASIADNILLPSLDALETCTFISPKKERELVERQKESLSIKCNSPKDYISTLSGGNKQKVSFAKWMAKESSVVIMDCPTRGVDVGVKQSMYQIMEDMKAEGKAILMISEELSELIGMSDRLLIMKDGKVTAGFQRKADLKQTDIIEYMI